MRSRNKLFLMVAAASFFACSEGLGPDANADDVLLSNTPNLVKWSADGPPSFSAEGDVVAAGDFGEDSPLFSVASTFEGVYTTSYKVMFWAVRGEHRYVQINNAGYSLTSSQWSAPFLRLDVFDPVTLPDGSAIAVGDSVLIGVYADPQTMQVQLYPHGLTFGEETELTMWYGGASGDLNGDGVVDEIDEKIEYNMLGIWYQASWNEPWTILEADQDFENDSFEVELEHFSGYGVAW